MTTVFREPEQERLYTFKLSSRANQQGKFRGHDLQLFQAIQKKTESAPGNRHLPQGGVFRHSAKCGVNHQETNNSHLQYREYAYAYCC